MKRLVVAFLAGALLSGVAVGVYSHQSKERELVSLWFVSELYDVQAASRDLSLLDDERVDAVRRAVLYELESSINRSYRLMVSEKPRIHARPNLVAGLNNAEERLSAGDGGDRLVRWLREVNSYVVDAALE